MLLETLIIARRLLGTLDNLSKLGANLDFTRTVLLLFTIILQILSLTIPLLDFTSVVC